MTRNRPLPFVVEKPPPVCRPFQNSTFRNLSRFGNDEEPENQLKMLTFRHESRFVATDSKSAEQIFAEHRKTRRVSNNKNREEPTT